MPEGPELEWRRKAGSQHGGAAVRTWQAAPQHHVREPSVGRLITETPSSTPMGQAHCQDPVGSDQEQGARPPWASGRLPMVLHIFPASHSVLISLNIFLH